MPVITCNKCGSTTNTTAAEYNFRDYTQGASRCYAKYEDNKWVKGCSYDEAPVPYTKSFVDSLIDSDIPNIRGTIDELLQ